MSDPIAASQALPVPREPLRVAARRMRWFRLALRSYLDQLGREIGCGFEVDDPKLAAIFVRWLRAVEAQKPSKPAERRPYFEFAAGLMLRELVADMPVLATGAPPTTHPSTAAAFWPEGYALTMFCLAVTSAAIAQEFDEEATIAPAIGDLRAWWSFRENAAEDPDVSIPFLETLLGHEPNWLAPALFSPRQHDVASPREPSRFVP